MQANIITSTKGHLRRLRYDRMGRYAVISISSGSVIIHPRSGLVDVLRIDLKASGIGLVSSALIAVFIRSHIDKTDTIVIQCDDQSVAIAVAGQACGDPKTYKEMTMAYRNLEEVQSILSDNQWHPIFKRGENVETI